MIYIQKRKEPDKLLTYRNQKNARFDDMDADVKEQLRQSLLKEQGHLCAYCMRRIEGNGDVKIEHWQARTLENELQYRNLLAVCMGGEGGPPEALSCDSKKGNRPITISPLNQSDMQRIYYKNNGEIHSSDTTKCMIRYRNSNGNWIEGDTSPDQDLSDALNLNYENGIPMQVRRTALNKFRQLLQPYKDEKSKREFLKKMKQQYSEQKEFLNPYVGILRWYIDKKLK